jgi:hypothetical protein
VDGQKARPDWRDRGCVVTKPYRMQRIGILNHEGGIWTPETFDNVAQAQANIDRFQRHNPRMDLSRHKPVPVRVTVSLIKPTPPAAQSEGGAGHE